jgi:hypothetical protein
MAPQAAALGWMKRLSLVKLNKSDVAAQAPNRATQRLTIPPVKSLEVQIRCAILNTFDALNMPGTVARA